MDRAPGDDAIWSARSSEEDDLAMPGKPDAEGFEVDQSGDGLDALWRAKESAHAAIVMDLWLPGCSVALGYESLNGIRIEWRLSPTSTLLCADFILPSSGPGRDGTGVS